MTWVAQHRSQDLCGLRLEDRFYFSPFGSGLGWYNSFDKDSIKRKAAIALKIQKANPGLGADIPCLRHQKWSNEKRDGVFFVQISHCSMKLFDRVPGVTRLSGRFYFAEQEVFGPESVNVSD